MLRGKSSNLGQVNHYYLKRDEAVKLAQALNEDKTLVANSSSVFNNDFIRCLYEFYEITSSGEITSHRKIHVSTGGPELQVQYDDNVTQSMTEVASDQSVLDQHLTEYFDGENEKVALVKSKIHQGVAAKAFELLHLKHQQSQMPGIPHSPISAIHFYKIATANPGESLFYITVATYNYSSIEVRGDEGQVDLVVHQQVNDVASTETKIIPPELRRDTFSNIRDKINNGKIVLLADYYEAYQVKFKNEGPNQSLSLAPCHQSVLSIYSSDYTADDHLFSAQPSPNDFKIPDPVKSIIQTEQLQHINQQTQLLAEIHADDLAPELKVYDEGEDSQERIDSVIQMLDKANQPSEPEVPQGLPVSPMPASPIQAPPVVPAAKTKAELEHELQTMIKLITATSTYQAIKSHQAGSTMRILNKLGLSSKDNERVRILNLIENNPTVDDADKFFTTLKMIGTEQKNQLLANDWVSALTFIRNPIRRILNKLGFFAIQSSDTEKLFKKLYEKQGKNVDRAEDLIRKIKNQ